MKLALIGFGNVGQGLASILRDKGADYGLQVVAVVTGSRGVLYHPDGLDVVALLDTIAMGSLVNYPYQEGLIDDWDAARIVTESNADVIVEASPTNLETGQPALDRCFAAIDVGKHVVLANKGPVAVAYTELMARADQAGVRVLFEGTVMAGTPSIRLATDALEGCEIKEIKGILNGTTNYILDQMERGQSYDDALSQAQELGYAETDPRGDVDGWDAAAKVLILAAVFFNRLMTLEDLDISGISHLTRADIEAARSADRRWKLIASISAEGGQVKAVQLPINDPLAGVGGALNALRYTTDLVGDVTLVGPGAGRIETGYALFSDILNLVK